MTPPATPPSTTVPRMSDYTYVCHGCNIMLKDFTRLHDKMEYAGPGYCLGCENRTEDGYFMKREIEEGLAEHREYIKKEMFWDYSQRAAAARRRQREIDALH